MVLTHLKFQGTYEYYKYISSAILISEECESNANRLLLFIFNAYTCNQCTMENQLRNIFDIQKYQAAYLDAIPSF